MASNNWPIEYDHVFRLLDSPVWYGDKCYFKCPAHDDEHRSAWARVGEKGLLLKCFAGTGCPFSDILAALSAQAGEQITCLPNNGKCGKGRRRVDYEASWELIHEWLYTDERGEILFRVRKYLDENKKKQFRQAQPSPDGCGAWVGNIDGVRRVLFNLPDLFENAGKPPEKRRTVSILEGEKDADTATEIGCLATTASGGAAKFHLSDYSVLQGCKVVIFPDIDEINPRTGRRAGWDHAVQCANLLMGVAEEVKVVVLPVQEGQDFTDWVNLARKTMDPKKIRTTLWEMVCSTPVFDPLRVGAPIPPFVADSQERLRLFRKQVPVPMHNVQEVLGYLDVELSGLRTFLGNIRAVGGGKVPPREMALLLAQVAAMAQRGAEDLKLYDENQKGDGGKS